MRTLYLPVFVITLLVAWVFLGWFGGDNIEYVGDLANDGRAWIKAKGTTTDGWSNPVRGEFPELSVGVDHFFRAQALPPPATARKDQDSF